MKQLAPWRNCRWGWLKGLDPAPAPSSECIPQISIPKINGKTIKRDITLFTQFACLLQEWSTGKPLLADNGQQWPAKGQPIETDAPLFPGFLSDGKKHCWQKAVSERAYAEWFRKTAASIGRARSAAANGLPHCFQDFPLDRMGTHSMKKTAVTLMAEALNVPWSVISAITGTVRMLQSTYDTATLHRQGKALHTSYASLFVGGSSPSPSPQEKERVKFCRMCGAACANSDRKYCTMNV